MRSRWHWAFPLLVMVAGCSSSGGDGRAARVWTHATALTGLEDSPFGMAVRGGDVAFVTGGSQVGENALRRTAIDASASTVVVTKPGGGIPNGGLAFPPDGSSVYVAVGSSIVRQPLEGGAATEVVAHRPAIVRSVAVDSQYVWWTTSQLNTPQVAELARMPLDGGTPEVIAAGADGGGSFGTVITDGSGGAYAASLAGVVRAAPDGTRSMFLPASAAGGAVTEIALDKRAGRLYALTTGAKNRIVAVPTAGGPPAAVVDGADSTGGIAATADGVMFFRLGPLGSTGKATLNVAPAGGGGATVVARGSYPEGSLAISGGRVVFLADDRVWSVAAP